MEAWAVAKWRRTSLHCLTPAQAGPGRTGLKVAKRVPQDEAHAPILLLSQVAHCQGPGVSLPHWTDLNHAPHFQPVSISVSGVCKEPREHRCWATRVRVWIPAWQ